jgi:hypothetical protein
MEPPDFEQIAWRLKNFVDDHPQLVQQNVRAIVEQLREVWNARGAADLGQLAKAKDAAPPFPQADTYVNHVERAIRILDR